MKRYYINSGDFANTYSLYWAETPEQIKAAEDAEYERISRKKAEALCRKEIDRRVYDQAFSGYASTEIYPIDFDRERFGQWENDKSCYQDGFIIERKPPRTPRATLQEIKFNGYDPSGRIIAWQYAGGDVFAADRDNWNGEVYGKVEYLTPGENGWVEFPGNPSPNIKPVFKQNGEDDFEIIGYEFV